jgi:hypothetical protein
VAKYVRVKFSWLELLGNTAYMAHRQIKGLINLSLFLELKGSKSGPPPLGFKGTDAGPLLRNQALLLGKILED